MIHFYLVSPYEESFAAQIKKTFPATMKKTKLQE